MDIIARPLGIGAVTLLLLTVGLAPASACHTGTCCTVEQADPTSYHRFDLVEGSVFYVEERGAPARDPPAPPLPGSGAALGKGTWVYQEVNGRDGLQRGGFGPFPCTAVPLPCLIMDPVTDESCSRGPDLLIHGVLGPA